MHAQTYYRSTHDDFLRLAGEHPNARVEIDAAGTITVTPPTGGASGHRNSRLNRAVLEWAEAHEYIAFDSSTGFALSDGSIVSPDAAAISLADWNAFSQAQREGFLPLAPAIAIEIASQSDRPSYLKAKLLRCRSVGTSFVALIDPYRKTIWTDGAPPESFSLDLESFLI